MLINDVRTARSLADILYFQETLSHSSGAFGRDLDFVYQIDSVSDCTAKTPVDLGVVVPTSWASRGWTSNNVEEMKVSECFCLRNKRRYNFWPRFK